MTDVVRSGLCAPGRGHQADHAGCHVGWCQCRCHRPSTPILDVGIPAKMTATLQLDLSKTEAIEQIGEFLESMNVVGLTIASGGHSVQCVGLVMSLVPSDDVRTTHEESP